MQFTSMRFALFAGALLLLYYRIPKHRQWQLLLLANMVFYIEAGLRYFLFLLITAATSFEAARFLENHRSRKSVCHRCLSTCLFLNFGMLAVCKIFLLLPDSNWFLSLGLPMGISFYIFQSIGYVIDVSRGREAEKSFAKFLLFVSYFPQLIQGPISKHADLQPQLMIPHAYNKKQVSFGLQRMLWGYFKKLVIADRIGTAVAVLRGPEYSGFPFLILTLFYALQIYGDFTGGIDIALGLSQALGITLPENFRHPFFSKNISEFWRRWHITLGSWMREYIFFPVSVCGPLRKLSKVARKHLGSFGKRLPVYIASGITWIATGIWHGLTPNFLLWGMLNFLVISLSEELAPLYRKFHKRFSWKDRPWYELFEMTRTFLLMNLIRSCDLFPDVNDYFLRIRSLLSPWELSFLWDGSLLELGLSGLDYLILIVGIWIMLAVSLVQVHNGSIRQILWNKPVLGNILGFGLLLSILLMGYYGIGYEASSFIYNQF